jgi:NitT/TauT family transport system ATP-binding protein
VAHVVPAMAGAGRLEVHALRHEYTRPGSNEHQLALDGVELDIKGGEFVCILGATGCGKSTLLMIMAGLVTPTSGSVALDGQPVTGPSKERGVVFQEYALLPWKTVRANVELGPRLQGRSRLETRELADRYLEMVGLSDSARKYPHELSGGMRQRAAVARTLAADPIVLLMDEPFAAVDAQTRRGLQEELVHIWGKTRRTIVFVTHSVEEAALLADRVVVLSASPGKVREVVSVCTARSNRFTPEGMAENAAVARRLLEALDGGNRRFERASSM